MVSLKRFFLAFFLILLATFLLVVLLPKTFGPNQGHLEVDLVDLGANTENFRDMEIRTKGAVKFYESIYQYEDFWLAPETEGCCGIPVVVRDAGLSVPPENSSIEVWGTIKYCELEGGFFYLDATLWEHAENIVSGTGTITFLNFEGGFYGIVSDNGDSYDPVNLAREFQVDGLRVRFEVRILQGVLSIHAWGKCVSILSIEKLD